MMGTFQPGDWLTVIQIPFEEIHIGDIVVYSNSCNNNDENCDLVHRIMLGRSEGFLTRGDNNVYYDSGFITKDNLIGKVKYVCRNNKTKPVVNGSLGFYRAKILYIRIKCWKLFRILSGGIYRRLRENGIISYFWKPKFNKLVLQTSDGILIKFLRKGHAIANWWPQQKRFTCRKPFDLVLRAPQNEK